MSEKKRKKRMSGEGPAPAVEARSGAATIAELSSFLSRLNNLFSPLLLAGLGLVLAFGARYYVAHYYAKGPDNFQYVALAKDLARGDYFRRDYDLDQGLANSRKLTPLYPALIAVGVKLTADPERAGAWIALIASALTVLPLFALGMKLGGKWGAAVAVLFYSVMPLDLYIATHILSDSLFGLLTATTVLAALGMIEKPSLFRAALLGLAAGLSYLARDIGFGFIFLAALTIFISARIQRSPLRQTLRRAAVCLLVFALLGLPFWIFIKVHTGKWRPSLRAGRDLPTALMGYEKGARPAGAGMDEDEGPGGPAPESKGPAAAVNPFRVALKTVVLTWEYLRAGFEFQAWPFWVMALAGIFLAPLRDREWWAKELAVWLFALGILGAYALLTPYMVDARYGLPCMVLATAWAGRGAVLLPVKARRLVPPALNWFVFPALILLIAVGVGYYLRDGYSQARRYRMFYSEDNFKNKTVAGVREAAEDAKKLLKLKPGARILDRKPFFAYYLDGRLVEIAETVEGVKKQAADGWCDYVVIESLSAARYRPGLRPLITAADPLPGAPLVYRRYLRNFDRMVSIYQPGGKGMVASFPLAVNPADKTQVQSLLDQANRLQDQGYLENARLILLSILAANPNNSDAHGQLIKIYLVYGYFDCVSLDLAADELLRYSSLGPRDTLTSHYGDTLQQLRVLCKAKWSRG